MSRQTYDIHPVTDRLEPTTHLNNYGGLGIDWVEFQDGTRSPLLSLRVPTEEEWHEIRRRNGLSEGSE